MPVKRLRAMELAAAAATALAATLYVRGDWLRGEAPLGNDAIAYASMAASIAASGVPTLPQIAAPGLSPESVWIFAPGFPALAAIPTALGVPPWIATPLVSTLALALGAALAVSLGFRIAGLVGAAIGLVATAGGFGAWTLATRGLSDPVLIPLTLAMAAFAARLERGGRFAIVALAVGAAAACAIRYAALPVLGYLALRWLLEWRGRGDALRWGACGLLAVALAFPIYLRWLLLKDDRAHGAGTIADALLDAARCGLSPLDGYVGTAAFLRAAELPPVLALGAVFYGGSAVTLFLLGLRWRCRADDATRELAELNLLGGCYLLGLPLLRVVAVFDLDSFRFLLPALPAIALSAGRALGTRARGAWIVVGVAGALAGVRLWQGVRLPVQDAPWRAGEWIRARTQPGDCVLVLDDYSSLNPYVGNRRLLAVPEADSPQAVARYARASGATYLVVFPRRRGARSGEASWPEATDRFERWVQEAPEVLRRDASSEDPRVFVFR